MEMLKGAYAEAAATQPHGDDWDAVSQAYGRYDGLKIAYELLTGRSPQDISNEVTTWYIHTPAWAEEKKHYDTRPGGQP
jgi:hypothetical protein